MKKIYTLALAGMMAASAYAQTNPTKININLTNGNTETFNLADIKDITFDGEEVTPPTPAGKAYKIEIPTDFAQSSVIRVMAGDEQVAEVCREYVRSFKVVDAQMVVVYPTDNAGKADLTQGLSAMDGGSLEWNLEADSVKSYVPGDGALTVVYVENGKIVPTTTATEILETTLEADVLVDKRGLNSVTYPIVKVGVQYWMGKNLAATTLNDGTSMPMYKSTQGSAWNAATSPAYHIYADDVTDEYKILSTYGIMYNGYAATSEKIAPEGWAVTTMDDWTKLKTYLGTSGGGKVRSTDVEAWDGATATNLSGLSIPGGGYYSTATDDDKMGTQVYLWTTDKGTDFLGRESDTNLKCVYMNKTSAIALTGNHALTFGHYIRCIRK